MGAERQAPAVEEHGDQSQADKAQRVDACLLVKTRDPTEQVLLHQAQERQASGPWIRERCCGYAGRILTEAGGGGRDLAVGAPLEQLPSLPSRPAVFC